MHQMHREKSKATNTKIISTWNSWNC